MQGKGLVKFFMWVLLIAVVYQLLLWWPAWRVESDAEAYAEEASLKEPDEALRKLKKDQLVQAYLDSISDEPVFSIPFIKSYTYQGLKKQQLALGLDLRGGMSVVLQVNLEDLVIALSGDSPDGTFRTAMLNARQAQRNSQSDFITLFVQEYEKISPDRKLASVFAASDRLAPRGIGVESSNQQVAQAIRQEANETVDRTYKLLKQRIDRFGVASPTVFLDQNTDRITVELPGVTNPKRARELLQATASLEFWEVFQNTEFYNQLNTINELLRKKAKAADMKGDSVKLDTTGGNTIVKTDSIGKTDSIPVAQNDSTNVNPLDSTDYGPLFKVLSPFVGGEIGNTPIVGIARLKDTATVNKLFNDAQARKILRNARLVWAAKPFKNETEGADFGVKFIHLYAINTKGKKEAPLQGDHITYAYPNPSSSKGGYAVNIDMDNEGAQAWKEMTQRNVGRPVAIVLDNKVYSAPNVENVIAGGNTEITGNFGADEATDLANILSVGKLPTRTEIIEEAIVGPSLGQNTVNAGLIALLVGFLSVLLFMLAYYAASGFVSIICLLLNVVFIIGSLASFGTVLTLPGIAGIVLTIGMAVDANVIIFERIREELRKGKTWGEAVNSGYSASYSSIIDANITTIAVATILFLYGLGPIKGFATVLITGVVCSVFTAVLVGRLIFDGRVIKNKPLSIGTSFTQNLMANPGIKFMAKRKVFYGISGVLIVAGLVSIFTRGFELGVDLQGGRSYTVEFPQDVDITALKDKITETFTATSGDKATEYGADKVIIKTFNEANQAKITTSFMQTALDNNVDSIVLARVFDGCKAYAGIDVDFAKFERGRPSTDDQPGMYLSASNKVGPTIADDIQNSAFIASILSVLAIFLYILIRFRRWQFSAGAIIALVHDVLIVLGLFSLLKGIMPFSMEVDQSFVAAILTIIGYSINDTVIVFDRIRETTREMKDSSLITIADTAINSTLSRTSMTSFTTFLVIFILFIFGGDAIRGFAFALTIGILVGTYSSIFIASPLVVDFTKDPNAWKFEEPEVPADVVTETPVEPEDKPKA